MALHEVKNPSGKMRRDRNAANGDCLNETKAGTHGKATHGTLCRRCRARHRGVPVEHVSEPIAALGARR